MTRDTDRGYFVKLDSIAESPRTAVARDLGLPEAKRHRRFQVRPISVLLILVLGGLAWAQTTPGGVSGHINTWIDKTRGNIDSATANPDLHRAETYYNTQVRRDEGVPEPD